MLIGIFSEAGSITVGAIVLVGVVAGTTRYCTRRQQALALAGDAPPQGVDTERRHEAPVRPHDAPVVIPDLVRLLRRASFIGGYV